MTMTISVTFPVPVPVSATGGTDETEDEQEHSGQERLDWSVNGLPALTQTARRLVDARAAAAFAP